jgi:hypothetical protein
MFLGLHYPLSWSNKFWNARGKRGSLATNIRGPWQRKYRFNFLICLLFVVKRKEGTKKGEKFKHEEKQIPKTTLFGHI